MFYLAFLINYFFVRYFLSIHYQFVSLKKLLPCGNSMVNLMKLNMSIVRVIFVRFPSITYIIWIKTLKFNIKVKSYVCESMVYILLNLTCIISCSVLLKGNPVGKMRRILSIENQLKKAYLNSCDMFVLLKLTVCLKNILCFQINFG